MSAPATLIFSEAYGGIQDGNRDTVVAMRKRSRWMTRADDEILEFLESEGAGTPKLIADEIDKNNNYLTTRCRKLESYGLVNRPSRGFYTITDDGTMYLSGDLDASELEADD